MANPAPLPLQQAVRLRVQMGAFSAQCSRCESHIFATVPDPDVLACDECGHEMQRTALLEQIAATARLTAEVIAEQTRSLSPEATAN